MPTIRQQLIAQVLTLLQPLKDAGTIRGLASSRFPATVDEKPSPYVHVMHPDEEVIDQTLGHGYTVEFDLQIAILVKTYRNQEALLEDLATQITATFEADPQLAGLATHCYYTGQVWFNTGETNGPGGCQLNYRVQYRRPYGDTTTSF